MSNDNATPILSIVLPVFNEEQNVERLLSELEKLKESLGDTTVEVIFVDDRSADATPTLLKAACSDSPWMRYFRLSKNRGSHVATLAGLEQSRGRCAVFLASDLQDPPDLIPKLLQEWKGGNQIVWAVRDGAAARSFRERTFSRLFYWALNRFSEVKLPPTGSDFALLDRAVIDALLESVGATPSLGGEIARLGFSQSEVRYTKRDRHAGASKWTRGAKIRAFIDALAAFSYVPMRVMSYAGVASALLGFIYILVIVGLRVFAHEPVPGWASLMVAVLVLGGIQMVMLGVLGEYLWRTLEEARKRPLYFIEESVDSESTASDKSIGE